MGSLLGAPAPAAGDLAPIDAPAIDFVGLLPILIVLGAAVLAVLVEAVVPSRPRHGVQLVLAIGHPAERRVLAPLGEDESIRYWRDAQGVHHVPKRSLGDVLVGRFGDSNE